MLSYQESGISYAIGGVLNSIGISICKGIQVNMFFKKFVIAGRKSIYCLGLGFIIK